MFIISLHFLCFAAFVAVRAGIQPGDVVKEVNHICAQIRYAMRRGSYTADKAAGKAKRQPKK